jgi:major type 1 subunit fimbrin (pilin)
MEVKATKIFYCLFIFKNLINYLELIYEKDALISALMSLSVFQAANAADGVINFTGNITGTACVVDTSAISQPVDLGTISTTAFTGGNGATAAAKRLTLC